MRDGLTKTSIELKKMMIDTNANEKNAKTGQTSLFIGFTVQKKYFAPCSLRWGIKNWARIWDRT